MKYGLIVFFALLPSIVMMEGGIEYPPLWWTCDFQEPTTIKETKVIKQRYFNPHKKTVVHGWWPWHCTAMAAYLRYEKYDINIRKFRTGNAKHRLNRAEKQWFTISDIPVAGSLMVMPWRWKRAEYWHVAYVQWVNINDGTVTVIDMNYKWKYIATKRTETITKALWFIYPEKPIGN